MPYTGNGYTIGRHSTQPEYDENSKLFISESGNVGIGTTDPVRPLHVILPDNGSLNGIRFEGLRSALGSHAVRLELTAQNSPAATDKKNFQIINLNSDSTGGQNKLIFRSVADAGAASSWIMSLTHGGNVGIGTTSPQDKLDILGASDATYGGRTIIGDDANHNPTTSFYRWTGIGSNYHASRLVEKGNGSDYGLEIQTADNAEIGSHAFSSKVTIKNSGDVGIGTTSPDSKLHISYADIISSPIANTLGIVVESSGDGAVNIVTPNNKGGYLNFGDPEDSNIGRIYYTHTDNKLWFATNADDRMVIDDSGNVGIGTTAPGAKLEVNADTNMSSGSDAYGLKVDVDEVGAGTNGPTQYGIHVSSFNGNWANNTVYGIYSEAVKSLPGNSPIYGVYGISRFLDTWDGSTTRPSAYGVVGGVEIDSQDDDSDTITDAYSLFSAGPVAATGDTITNHYGVYVQSPSGAGTVTNNYAIVTEANAGNVGIGTTNPQAKLTLGSGHILLAANGRIGSGATSDTPEDSYIKFYSGATKQIDFATSNGTKMVLDSSGNLGIGTTNPVDKLSILKAVGNDIPAAGIILSRYQASPSDMRAGGIFNYYDSSSSKEVLAFGLSQGGTPNTIANTKMVIRNDGNVGIGTTDPKAKFNIHTQTVGGARVIPSAQADELLIENNSNAGLTIGTANIGSIYVGDNNTNNLGQLSYAVTDNS